MKKQKWNVGKELSENYEFMTFAYYGLIAHQKSEKAMVNYVRKSEIVEDARLFKKPLGSDMLRMLNREQQPLNIVVKAHLFLEHFIDVIIQKKFRNSQLLLQNNAFTFAMKLDVLRAKNCVDTHGQARGTLISIRNSGKVLFPVSQKGPICKLLWYHKDMKQMEKDKIVNVTRAHPEIKLVYLFGSQASENAGALSDYDIAVYADGRDRKELFDLRLLLMDEIGRALGTDRIDVIMLNLTEGSELKYQIIRDGIVLYEEEPYKMLVEPKILNEYFDFHEILRRHGLTAA